MSARRRIHPSGMKKRNGGAARSVERHGLMLTLMIAALLAVAGRLVYLQVIVAPAHAEMAREQWTQEVVLQPRRGMILDREGEPLAVSQEARSVTANPRVVADATATAEALAVILGGEADSYAQRLARDAGFAYIARKIDMERVEAIRALDIDGLGFEKASRRVYPGGELAAQVLGFVGVDDVGLAGLEAFYEEILGGTPGYARALSLPRNNLESPMRPMPGGIVERVEPVHGSDIIVSLDQDIQHAAQTALAAAVEKWDAKSGSIVIMNPQTGAIMAMASAPSFDLNRFSEAEPTALRNRPVTDAYEPGSTMKAITAAAVIEEGLFTPDDRFVLPPTLRVGGRTIGEAYPRSQVEWTLSEIVVNSSNVGSVKLGQALGEERLHRYLLDFGFTARTGVDFQGEAAGFMPALESWSASTIANIPFGQGISTTPLQVTRAVAAIANGGELVTPHFLVDVPSQPDLELKHPRRRVISEQTAAQIREILKASVGEDTGSKAAVDGYVIAGKTGTAQKAREDGRGYMPGAYMASFVGFLPADDPAFVMIVVIDEPKGAIYGSVVAAPVFSEVARFTAAHLRVPPTGNTSAEPSGVGMTTRGDSE